MRSEGSGYDNIWCRNQNLVDDFWAYARTRTPAHVYPAHMHAHTFPRPVDSSAILLLLFLSKIHIVDDCWNSCVSDRGVAETVTERE